MINIPNNLKKYGMFCKVKVQAKMPVPLSIENNAVLNPSKEYGFVPYSKLEKSIDFADGIALGIFNPICAIDINNCVENGIIKEEVKALISDCNTYAEISPSGKGVRIIFKADGFEFDKNQFNIRNIDLKAEMLVNNSNDKFLILTGNTINQLDVTNIKLDMILNKYFNKEIVVKTNHLELNDTGFAKKFVEMFGENLRYNYTQKMWMLWNGKYWQYDNANTVKIKVDILAEMIKRIAFDMSSEEGSLRNKYLRASDYLFSRRGKENVLNECQYLIPVCEEQFDTHDYLLNTKSGILDLKNGVILPHNRDYYLTKYLDYELDERSPELYWKTLEEVYQGDIEIIEYINRLFSYCLTGDTSEQQIYFFTGSGRNGKSLLIETINSLLGEYAQTAETSLICDKDFQTKSKSELAGLKGKRMVIMSELDPNQKLKSADVKKITGGEEVVACFKYKQEFSYRPKYKLFQSTNHMPRCNDDSIGMQDRLIEIKHNRYFEEHERDKKLINKLLEEKGKILNLLFRICPSTLKNGLQTPQKIKDNSKEYFKNEDVINFWLEENTIKSVGSTLSKDLFADFKDWCIKSNETYYAKQSQNWFSRRLSKYYKNIKQSGQSFFIGLELK